jgi:hypothetical protein
MTLRHRIKASFLALGLIGLAACGSEPVDPAVFDAEVAQLAESGDLYGQMFVVLKDRRPEVYNDFRRHAFREYSRGRTARDAGYLAGRHIRKQLNNELLQLSRVASDEDVKEMISIMIATFEHIEQENAKDCERLANGEELEHVKDFPNELRKRETKLIVELLNAPQTVANRRAASRNEITNWMMNVATLEPSVDKMMSHLANAETRSKKRSKGVPKEICQGMVKMYKRLSYKPSDDRGTLFRGMALMALQQQQLRRNTSEEESA